MVNQIYPPELQLNKANTSDTEAPFLDLHLSILNGFVSSKIYDKRDDFDFDIVNFPFLDGDVQRRSSYGVLHRNIHLTLTLKSLCMIRLKEDDEVLINNRHRTFPAKYGSIAIIDLFFVISF